MPPEISILITIILFFSIFVRFYAGGLRRWVVFNPLRTIYAAGPMTVTMIGLYVAILLRDQVSQDGQMWIAMGSSWTCFMLLLGIYFFPGRMTPWWVRYLWNTYPDISKERFYKAAAADYDRWLERTQTPEGLAAWAAEVAAEIEKN